MNKLVKNILKIMSNEEFDLEKSRKFVKIKAIDPLKSRYETVDAYVENGDFQVPVRLYFPNNARRFLCACRAKKYQAKKRGSFSP